MPDFGEADQRAMAQDIRDSAQQYLQQNVAQPAAKLSAALNAMDTNLSNRLATELSVAMLGLPEQISNPDSAAFVPPSLTRLLKQIGVESERVMALPATVESYRVKAAQGAIANATVQHLQGALSEEAVEQNVIQPVAARYVA